MARGVAAVVAEVTELVDVESVRTDVGAVGTVLAVILREVPDTSSDLGIAGVGTTGRLEDLSPSVDSGAVGWSEDSVSAAVLDGRIGSEVPLVPVDLTITIEVEGVGALSLALVSAANSVSRSEVSESVPELFSTKAARVVVIKGIESILGRLSTEAEAKPASAAVIGTVSLSVVRRSKRDEEGHG